MEILVVGVLSGLGFLLSTLLWHVYVQPDVVLSLLDDHAVSAGPAKEADERSLRWIRGLLAVLVLASGFLTGAALAFLTATD